MPIIKLFLLGLPKHFNCRGTLFQWACWTFYHWQSENSPLSANCRTRQCSNEATLEWENHVFSVILHSSPQECCLFAHRLLLRGQNDDILGVLWAGVTSLTMWQPPPWKPLLCTSELHQIHNGVCPCVHSYSSVGKYHKLDRKTVYTTVNVCTLFTSYFFFFSLI